MKKVTLIILVVIAVFSSPIMTANAFESKSTNPEQVKIFFGNDSPSPGWNDINYATATKKVEEKVNLWLKENRNITITQRLLSTSLNSSLYVITITIFYR